MRLNNPKIIFFVIILILSTLTCFPAKKATLIMKENMRSSNTTLAPTKIFLLDASVILFPYGITTQNDTILGKGHRYWLDRNDEQLKKYIVPYDSVAALTYYELHHSAAGNVGSFLLGLYGGYLTPLSIYCLSCPKCCFGSCPTAYISDSGEYRLKAELFSYSISKYFQETDIDRIKPSPNSNGQFHFRISNEALETHYINQLSLITINHPIGSQIFPCENGPLVAISQLRHPANACNSYGKNVLDLVCERDNSWYRSDSTFIKKLSKNTTNDWLDVKLNIPTDTNNVKFVLRLRNTLLSTILFYDIVLASQGIAAVDWTYRMNSDSSYATIFNELWKHYSGIKVYVKCNNKWQLETTINDVGPIAWKETAINIPITSGKVNSIGELSVRFEFFLDNFLIDYVAYDVERINSKSIVQTDIKPEHIYDDSGNERADILKLINNDDTKFLITNPGESYYFHYDVETVAEMETSLFIRSKGYYTEWIRGNWLNDQSSAYNFSLFNIDETIMQLKLSWLENRELIETEFFKTRIPLKGDL